MNRSDRVAIQALRRRQREASDAWWMNVVWPIGDVEEHLSPRGISQVAERQRETLDEARARRAGAYGRRW